MKCEICNEEHPPLGMSSHLKKHNLSTKVYYDLYIKQENEGLCKNCKNITEFISINDGYEKLCENCKPKRKQNNYTCKICNEIFHNPTHLKKHNITLKEYYDKYLKQPNDGICNTCGKPTKFLGISGYSKFCDSKCANSNIDKINKCKQTCINHFGCESNLNITKVKEKVAKKQGSKETKEKRKQTFMNIYGVDNPLSAPEIRHKIEQTNLERFGATNPNKNKKVRDKIKQTSIERYGYENPSQSDKVKEKLKKSYTDKNGGMGFASKSVRNKYKHTLQEKYGNENYVNIEKMLKTRKENNIIDQRLDENNL